MDASFTQSGFFGGEISPLAQGRIDDPRYRMSMNVCLNAVVAETGAWLRRGGTRHVAQTRSGLPGRLIKFDFESDAPVNMEFTDGFLRFVKGARLVTTNDDRTILSINNETPAVITLDADHGWSDGDQVYVDTGDAHLRNRVLSITVHDTDKIAVSDAITGEAIIGIALSITDTGTVRRIHELATTYGDAAWQSIKPVQAQTSTTLLHPSFRPYVVNVTNEPDERIDPSFSLEEVTFVDGPYLDPVTGGGLLTPSALNGLVTMTLEFSAWDAARAYAVGDFASYDGLNYQSLIDANFNDQPDTHPASWEVVDPSIAAGPDGFTGGDVGRHIRLLSEPDEWDSTSTYSYRDPVKYKGAYWTSLVNGNLNNPPGVDLTKWAVSPNAARWTWGKINSIASLIGILPGAVGLGNMTEGGGRSAAFDGTTTDNAANSARYSVAAELRRNDRHVVTTAWLGQNYTNPGAQTISKVTIFPSSDKGLCYTGKHPVVAPTKVILNLRASNTVPATSDDGTLLGTRTLSQSANRALSIRSNDRTTAWDYVWVEIVTTFTLVDVTDPRINATLITAVAEMQFFSPDAGSASSIIVQIMGDKLLYTTPIAVWRLGAYSDELGWPSCGTYAAGRIWLAGAIGNRFDASKPLDPRSDKLVFSPTETDGTVTDASAISYTFTAKDVNPIFWMEEDAQGVIAGTKTGEWLIKGSSPLNIQADRVTRNGCADIEPRRTEHTLVFVQRYGRKCIEYFADVYSGKFSAPNLHERAKHMTTEGIAEIAYQQELAPIIWARLNDGSLIGGSYKRQTLTTSQGPTYMGWHRHTLGSERTIESICSGPNEDSTLDALMMVTTDASGIRHIELMTDLPTEATTLLNGWFLDNGLIPTTETVTVSGKPHLRCSGLWAHEGKEVAVWAGGLDLGDYTVEDGTVDVPFAADAERLFTQAYLAANADMLVIVGFPYTSDGQIVRPATQQESGTRNGPGLGKKRRAVHYAMLVETTKGLKAGTQFTKLNKANFTTSPDGGATLTALQAKSGIHWQSLTDDHGFDSALCWRIERPYPGAVAAVTEMLDTKDQ